MPSVKNPNGPSKNRAAAKTATARKHSAKQLARKARTEKHKISKADATRGARPGILPTSGPNAAVSGKKQRKLQRKLGYAVKRKMEADGEVEMKDIADEQDAKKKKTTKTEEQSAVTEDMNMDADNVS